MGSNTSKTSKVERKERNELRDTKINNNIKNIKQFEQKIIQSARANNTDVVNYDSLKTYLDITSSATQQLMREGKPFTKKDFIAIIVALHPDQIANIKLLDTLTVTDLISMIRTTIYDMNRYMNHCSENDVSANQMQPQSDLTIVQNKRVSKNAIAIQDKRVVESNQLVLIPTRI